jgi:hypothetical protein
MLGCCLRPKVLLCAAHDEFTVDEALGSVHAQHGHNEGMPANCFHNAP